MAASICSHGALRGFFRPSSLRFLRSTNVSPLRTVRLNIPRSPVRSFASKKSAPKPKRKTTTTLQPKKAAPPAPPPPPKSEPKYSSLSEQLGALGKPTMLYACHPTVFVGCCYGISLGSIAYCIYLYKANIENVPDSLPGWVVKANWFAIAGMSLVAMTCWFYPTRIVQKIFAHPVSAVGNRTPSIQIVLHRRPLVPFFPAKKIPIESPTKLILDKAFHEISPQIPAPQPVVVAEPQKANVVIRMARKIFESPFRTFMVARRMITTQDFVTLINQDGTSFQIHKNGWVWRRRGLDELFGARKF